MSMEHSSSPIRRKGRSNTELEESLVDKKTSKSGSFSAASAPTCSKSSLYDSSQDKEKGKPASYSMLPGLHDNFPPWWRNFFSSPYCEDWPQYGVKGSLEAEDTLPSLKCTLQQNPTLLEDIEVIPELDNEPGRWDFLMFVSSVFSYAAQIASMMSLAKTFISGIPSAEVKTFGETRFSIVSNLLIYTPLVFAIMIPSMYQAKRSTDAFYYCFARGYMLDFPEDNSVTYFVTRRFGIFYCSLLFFYLIFGAALLLEFQAELTLWIIFGTNVVLGLGFTWQNYFHVEDKLISLSEFVQMMDTRGEEMEKEAEKKGHSLHLPLVQSPVIDQYTIAKAAEMLRRIKPLRTRAGYKEYTNISVFRVSKAKKYFLRFVVGFVMLALGGAMYGIFALSAQQEEKDFWVGQVSPCTQVCFDHGERNRSHCFNCMCDCATAFGIQYTSYTCGMWLQVPGCDNEKTCTGTCGGRE